MCSSKSYITDQTVTEGLTTWKLVKFCRDLSLQDVIIERDAMKVIQALRKEERCWSRYG